MISHYDIDGSHWDYTRYPGHDLIISASVFSDLKDARDCQTTPFCGKERTGWP